MNGGIDDTVRGCIVWVLIANTQLLHSCCYMMQQEKKMWRGNRLWQTSGRRRLAMFVLSDWPLKVLIEGDDLFANACSMLPRLNLLCLLLTVGQMELQHCPMPSRRLQFCTLVHCLLITLLAHTVPHSVTRSQLIVCWPIIMYDLCPGN